MKSVIELFYNQLDGCESIQGENSSFVKNARIKSENMDLLNASLSEEQKELLEAYFDADTKMEEMINLNRFTYAFHLGAQTMAEMIRGREQLLNQKTYN